VYADQAGSVTNISQPLGQPVRTDTAGFGFIDSLHATSDDGHLVAFDSGAPAFGATFGSDEANAQVLVRNVVTGQTQLVSAVSGGASPGNGFSDDASVDAAGDKVAFESGATNLVPGLVDANGSSDVFVRDLATGQTTLVDRTPGGGVPLKGADDPEISADGTKVAFITRSQDLPGSPADDNEHVYEVDLATGNVTLLDQTNSGVPANGDARGLDVDGDGGRVAFESDAPNLGGSTNDSVYVRDLTNPAHPTTTWVSVPQDGQAADDNAVEPAIDATGSEVAWLEQDSSFGFGMSPSAEEEIFVRNLNTHATTLASTGPSGAANQYSYGPSLSDNGALVAFAAAATNLPGAVTDHDGVFVRNLVNGTTTIAATRNGSSAAGDLGADDGSISGNGDCVAFDSSSDDLVAGGYSSDFEHVFLHALNGACPPVAVPPPTPAITKLSVTHKRFAVGSKATALTASHKHKHKHKPPPRGTTFKFKLSITASTRIVITRKHKHKTLLTLVRKHTRAGANAVAFSGRYGKKKHLAPGTYTAAVTATTAAGKNSKPRSVTFTVVE
jgi:Tol biopolymer transport system component